MPSAAAPSDTPWADTPPASRHRPTGHWLRPAANIAAALVLGGSAVGLLSRWHWLFDLTTHFREYWFLLSVIGLGLALLARLPTAAVILAVAVAVNAADLARYWLPAAARPTIDDSRSIRLVSMNVRRINRDTAAAVAYLRGHRPDVAVVLEVDEHWAAALEGLEDVFPHRVIVPRPDNFGIAVLARYPLADTRVEAFTASGYPSIVTTVRPDTGDHDSGDFRIVATHPYPPFHATAWAMLRAHLRGVAAEASRGPLPCVVLGDLNATPWSHPFRSLLEAGGLVDSAVGRGVQATYHAGLPAPRIPIDHVLVPPGTAVLHRRLGPAIGSDHFPVEAEIVLP